MKTLPKVLIQKVRLSAEIRWQKLFIQDCLTGKCPHVICLKIFLGAPFDCIFLRSNLNSVVVQWNALISFLFPFSPYNYRIVDKINCSIGQDPDSKSLIGVLDIYGFESFKTNRCLAGTLTYYYELSMSCHGFMNVLYENFLSFTCIEMPAKLSKGSLIVFLFFMIEAHLLDSS